jgi:hypothetical protein
MAFSFAGRSNRLPEHDPKEGAFFGRKPNPPATRARFVGCDDHAQAINKQARLPPFRLQ